MANSIAQRSRMPSINRVRELELASNQHNKEFTKVLNSMMNDISNLIFGLDPNHDPEQFLLSLQDRLHRVKSSFHHFTYTEDAMRRILSDEAESKESLLQVRDFLVEQLGGMALDQTPSEKIEHNSREAMPCFLVIEIGQRVRQLIRLSVNNQTVGQTKNHEELTKKIREKELRIQDLLHDLDRTNGNNEDWLQRYHQQRAEIEKHDGFMTDANRRLGIQEAKIAEFTATIKQLELKEMNYRLAIARLEGARDERNIIYNTAPDVKKPEKVGRRKKCVLWLKNLGRKLFSRRTRS